MVADMAAFPFLIRDLAGQLFEHELIAEAQAYYQFLRSLPDEPDALILLQLGRCHLLKGESSAAEECFLAAIEADVDNIDARVELANLYSTAHEDEEALILVNEAMTLQETQAALASGGAGADRDKLKPLPSRRSYYLHRPKGASVRFKAKPSGVIPTRYRPKRLVDPDMRRREEMERAQRLSTQYLTVQDLKAKIREGNEDLVPAWMAAAKELIDDFRSYRKFYSWDKYLKFLGRTNATLQQREAGQLSNLDVIAERLSKGKDYFLVREEESNLLNLLIFFFFQQLLSYLRRLTRRMEVSATRTLKNTRASPLGTGLICSSTTRLVLRQLDSMRSRTGCVRRPRTLRSLPCRRTMSFSSTSLGAVSFFYILVASC